MNFVDFNKGLSSFLQASPTPFHAVSMMVGKLEEAGYIGLDEGDVWQLSQHQGYYVTRNDSSLIAFHTGTGDIVNHGIKMVGAHTDSPCLKLKPQPEISKHGYAQLGVEVYGGALLNPWFDRDLSIAGRVNYLDKNDLIASCLVDFKKAIAVIPSLAIHLDREANQKRSINSQTYLPPVVLQLKDGESMDFKAILLKFLKESLALKEAVKVLDYELSLYDVQPPAHIGFNDEFFASARLDNLLSCYVGLESLLAGGHDWRAASGSTALLVCTDHEEVGSVSAAGANGPFLEAVLERIVEKLAVSGDSEAKQRMLSNSFMISVDNAHGIHPNFSEKHDRNHGPILNKGPVIKTNANQRYASNSETSAMFRRLCEQHEVPLQSFVVRSDMGCGSTIGPIVAGELGVKTLDIGVATFAMHSIRELAGSKDACYLTKVLSQFLK